MSTTVGGRPLERIIVEDGTATGSCDDRRIARIVIQEAGIPGPQGENADLSAVDFTPPLAWDALTNSVFLQAPAQVGQVYRWDGFAWHAFTLPERTVENRTITAAEANAKQIELVRPVTDAEKIVFDIGNGGGPQFLNEDFVLVGDQIIRWADGPLDGVIEAGDKFRIVYE